MLAAMKLHRQVGFKVAQKSRLCEPGAKLKSSHLRQKGWSRVSGGLLRYIVLTCKHAVEESTGIKSTVCCFSFIVQSQDVVDS